ncbi:MAG: thermostable hemolysin [Alphaproteobacteria bacterium]|nr:thermostable hemolysin [Alphaproteobacteria bacterium]
MLNLSYSENGLQTARLSFRKNAWLSHIKAKPSVVSIVPAFSQGRAEVENFITTIYAYAYGAYIHVHYPVLMSVRDDAGQILAATGFRCADDEPLFLEQYLTSPIDQVLQAPRGEIVEIGNLASQGGGASLYLFAALSAYLNHKGFTKAAVTSTDFLERRFRQMGLQPRRHAKADPALLLEEGENWGTYYDTQPHVIPVLWRKATNFCRKNWARNIPIAAPVFIPRLHYKGTPRVIFIRTDFLP